MVPELGLLPTMAVRDLVGRIIFASLRYRTPPESNDDCCDLHYQHCAQKHLYRYLAEFDFRYSNRIALGVDDRDRADKTIRGMVDKRLTCRGCSMKNV